LDTGERGAPSEPVGTAELDEQQRMLRSRWLGRKVRIAVGGLYGSILCPAGFEGVVSGTLATWDTKGRPQLQLRVTFENGNSIAVPPEGVQPIRAEAGPANLAQETAPPQRRPRSA
jgi:hypothetical protein